MFNKKIVETKATEVVTKVLTNPEFKNWEFPELNLLENR